MTLSELIQEIHSLNSTEQLYKTYQELKYSPLQLKKFLNTLDIDLLTKHQLIIPEIPDTFPPSIKEDFYYIDSPTGISIEKHNCYTPKFSHWHSFFEAFYIYEGSCELDIEGTQYTLITGDFFIIPPGIEHATAVHGQSIVIVIALNRSSLENTFSNPVYHRKRSPDIKYTSTSFLIFIKKGVLSLQCIH